jgi:ketopantoate hydroxymethyltransferase
LTALKQQHQRITMVTAYDAPSARFADTAGIDAIQLRTDQAYTSALGRFFETRERRRLRG